MKTSNIFKACTLGFALWATGASAQDASTAYFMKYSSLQHYQNPAFQPYYNFYIGVPGLSSINLKAGNNSLNFTDVIKKGKVNGEEQTMLFFDKNAKNGIPNFLDALKDRLQVYEEYRLSLIDFGFKLRKGYVTFNVSNRSDVRISVPKAIPQLAFEGMKEGQTFDFHADELSVSASLYTEIAAGYSHKINDELTVGGKLKYLYGHANATTKFHDLTITGNEKEWNIKGEGSVHAAIPGLEIQEDKEGKIDKVEFNDDLEVSDFTKPSGNGFAIDLGGTYQLMPELMLSASVTDLGFLRWSKNLNQVDKIKDFKYDGIVYDINDDSTDYYEKYGDMLEEMFKKKSKADAYTSWLTAKVNLAAEYSILENKLGFGVLSKTYINQGAFDEDFRISANYRPTKIISLSASYGMFDGSWNNIGLGMNLNAGPINFYCMVDHTPLHYAKSGSVMIPSKATYLQASLGMNLVFGDPNKKKKDKTSKLNETQPELVEEQKSTKEEELSRNIPLSPDNNPPAIVKVDTVPVVENVIPAVEKETVPVVNKDTVPAVKKDTVAVVVEPEKPEVRDTEVVRKKIEDSQLNTEEKAMATRIKGIKYLGNGLMGLDKSSYASLDKLAEFLKQHPEYGVNIKSYNNTEKKEEFNYAISREHAMLIAEYLTSVKGISQDRVSWEGMGSDNAKAKKETWKQKTEVEFYK